MLDTVTLLPPHPCRLVTRLPGRRKIRVVRGLKLWASESGQFLERVESSLPIVQYGHNGQLLAEQSQIDGALDKCGMHLRQIAQIGHISAWLPRRVDIVFNFALDAKPIILAHSHSQLPPIRRGPTLFDGGYGISWRGAKSHIKVTFYDKAHQMRVCGSVLRVEISLGGDHLTRRLPNETWRDFYALWRVYRTILIGIAPIQKPSMAENWQEALGLESAEIRTRVLARLAHLPSRTWRRHAQKVAAAASGLVETFCWADILPVEGPPVPVRVQSRPRRRLPNASPDATSHPEDDQKRRYVISAFH